MAADMDDFRLAEARTDDVTVWTGRYCTFFWHPSWNAFQVQQKVR
ncbi:hypothetical protein [Komagataeibacter saccharivorans]|nr:hypothetical protein [Komagataeibacter saccharivorans]